MSPCGSHKLVGVGALGLICELGRLLVSQEIKKNRKKRFSARLFDGFDWHLKKGVSVDAIPTMLSANQAMCWICLWFAF